VLEQLCLAAEVRYGLHSCAQFYELCVIKRVTLWPPDVVRTAINKGIRLARYVDIGVAHSRAPEDLDWLDWLVAELGGLAQTTSIRLRPANRRSSKALAAARNCVDRSGYSLGFIEASAKGKAASRRNRAGAFRARRRGPGEQTASALHFKVTTRRCGCRGSGGSVHRPSCLTLCIRSR
jgi:hypothetical protein